MVDNSLEKVVDNSLEKVEDNSWEKVEDNFLEKLEDNFLASSHLNQSCRLFEQEVSIAVVKELKQ